VGSCKLCIGLAVLLFFTAWTFDYWQAWFFLAVYSLSVLAVTLDLMKKDPKLLERRLKRESRLRKAKGSKNPEFPHIEGLVSGGRCFRN